MTSSTTLFKGRMALLTMIAFISHIIVLSISDWHFPISHNSDIVIALVFAVVPFFLFIFLPSLFIFRLKIPTFFQYILLSVSSSLLFQNLPLLDEELSALIGVDYVIISIILFCAFHLYGLISIEIAEEEKA